MALLHLGATDEIEDLETDTSKSARVMKRLYPNLRRALLSVWDWPFATFFQKGALSLFWPTPQWPYAWQYPAGCLKMVRIWNGHNTDDIQTKIEQVQAQGATSRLIYTKFGPPALLPIDRWIPTTTPAPGNGSPWPVPVFEFVGDIQNPALMPQIFKDALALYMAAYAAPSIPGIGSVDLREKNLALAGQTLQLAGAQNMNEVFITPEKRSLIERAASGEGFAIPFTPGFNNYIGVNWNP